MCIRYPENTWSVVSTDLIGPLPYSSNGNCYLLLFQDTFSKWVEFKPLRRATGQTVSDAFEKLVLHRYGAPNTLLSDNGPQYANKLFIELAKQYAINHRFTPPYSPQCNPVERTNRTIKTMIRQFCEENHKSWDKHLSEIIFAWNTSEHRSTGYSPSFLVYGREPLLPKSLRYELCEGKVEPEKGEIKGCIDRRCKLLKDAYERVRDNLRKAAESQKRSYDLRRRNVNFNVGDQVLRRNYVLSKASKHFSASLAPKFVGPYVVHGKQGPNIYELVDKDGNDSGRWHVKDLKPFQS